MTPRGCEHTGCVVHCRHAETIRPPCDDPEPWECDDVELHRMPRGCACCGEADCGGECHDDSPTAADVREGEERAAMAYARMHGVTL